MVFVDGLDIRKLFFHYFLLERGNLYSTVLLNKKILNIHERPFPAMV